MTEASSFLNQEELCLSRGVEGEGSLSPAVGGEKALERGGGRWKGGDNSEPPRFGGGGSNFSYKEGG